MKIAGLCLAVSAMFAVQVSASPSYDDSLSELTLESSHVACCDLTGYSVLCCTHHYVAQHCCEVYVDGTHLCWWQEECER